ncbi:MAG: phage holin family protein [Anaerolineales bacterium]
MSRFLLRLVINGLALYIAIILVPGIQVQDPNPLTYVWLALIFGILNALVKPILKLATCPVIFLTLGLFTLIINTALFYLTGWIGDQFGVGFTIDGFGWGFLGALVVSIVSVFFNIVLRDELKAGRRSQRVKRKP